MRVLLRSIRGSEEVSHHPWDPMDPPEVGPIRYPGMPGRVRYMDYATQSSRVGARVPYSLLRGTACAAIYYHSVVVSLAMPVGVPLAP